MARFTSSMGIAALAFYLAACSTNLSATDDETPSDDAVDSSDGTTSEEPEACVSDTAFFEEEVWLNVVGQTCISCHTSSGAAQASDLILQTPDQSGYLAHNESVLRDIASLERDGMSLLLRKPIGLDNHGGGAVLSEESTEYQVLEQFVARLDAPVRCEGDAEIVSVEGLELMTPVDTLRKAALNLVGRLPTEAETALVSAGGEPALRRALRSMMQEEGFYERTKEVFNDSFLTDRYMPGQEALKLLDDDVYPMRYWYDFLNSEQYSRNTMRARANAAVAQEPLELLVYLLRENLGYDLMVTADFTVANEYSIASYSLDGDITVPDPDDPSAEEFVLHRVPGVQHAGVLTMPVYLNRYPSTATNRNRHRARVLYDRFLATDILATAARPIDPTATDVHNPTLNDPQCNVCHNVIDPVAGAFQNWGNSGRFDPPDEGWYPEMAIPGFNGQTMPGYDKSRALQWLGDQIASDQRFALAPVYIVFKGLTGLDVLTSGEAAANRDTATAYSLQAAEFGRIADLFRDSGYDLRVVFEELLTGPYFRAIRAETDDPGVLMLAGTAQLLTPEALHRKIKAVSGQNYRARRWQSDLLLNNYRLLYGGIDSNSVVERLGEPNGIMGSIGLRMATEMACWSAARDLVLNQSSRRLFPHIEASFVPESDDGFRIPDVENRIRQNIQHLHASLLGEKLSIDSAEIDATYQLWYDTWKEGRANVDDGIESVNLHGECRAQRDFWTTEWFPSDRQVVRDEEYTIRAWMAVLTYLYSDFKFLHE